MLDLTDSTFDQFIAEHPGIVVLYCFDNDIAGCSELEPVLSNLHAEFADQVRFCRLNVRENPDMVGRFSLFSSPMLLMFDSGTPVAEIIGVLPERTIRLKLMTLLEE